MDPAYERTKGITTEALGPGGLLQHITAVHCTTSGRPLFLSQRDPFGMTHSQTGKRNPSDRPTEHRMECGT